MRSRDTNLDQFSTFDDRIDTLKFAHIDQRVAVHSDNVGKAPDAAVLAAAQAALDSDLDPAADQHGGPAMKRQLARTLLARAVARLLASPDSSEGRAA